MDDRLAQLEHKLAETRQELADFRRQLSKTLDESFKWSIITMGVAVIISWFGIFLLLTRGASLIRRFMLS